MVTFGSVSETSLKAVSIAMKPGFSKSIAKRAQSSAAMKGAISGRYSCATKIARASQSQSIFSNASLLAILDSGTTHAPARKMPLNSSAYAIEFGDRMAMFPPPKFVTKLAIRLTLVSKASHVRASLPQTRANRSGCACAFLRIRDTISSPKPAAGIGAFIIMRASLHVRARPPTSAMHKWRRPSGTTPHNSMPTYRSAASQSATRQRTA